MLLDGLVKSNWNFSRSRTNFTYLICHGELYIKSLEDHVRHGGVYFLTVWTCTCSFVFLYEQFLWNMPLFSAIFRVYFFSKHALFDSKSQDFCCSKSFGSYKIFLKLFFAYLGGKQIITQLIHKFLFAFET